MERICVIRKEIYRCVTEDITTDEVVITDTQIKHVQERHPDDYARYIDLITQAIVEPDYLLKDRENTALILKRIETENDRVQIVLRLHTSIDPKGYKNSVISFWHISERKWNQYLRNKIVLYKRTDL